MNSNAYLTASSEPRPAALRKQRTTWWVVVLYAMAMAWVESAVVLDLRTLTGRIEPYQRNPLPEIGGLAEAELVREVATMIMLLAVGCLAGRSWRGRLGYTLVAFGVWDIFYYIWLKVLTGWPKGLLDWDLLFLLPLPWWGPVLAPMLIAGLMIAWGTLAGRAEAAGCPRKDDRRVLAWISVGISLALYVFMADALRVAGAGPEVIRNVLPERFNWPLFLIAFLLMAMPVLKEARHHQRQRHWFAVPSPEKAGESAL